MTTNSPSSNLCAHNIRAVVFDLDGLMFNTEEVFNASGRELLRRRGHELTPEILVKMMGRRAEESFAELRIELNIKEEVPELLAESATIFQSLIDDILAPMPGLFDLLEKIEQKNLPKAVATSSSRVYLKDILSRYSLQERFDLLLTAEDVSQGKPHPEIYLKAAEQLKIAPQEMLVLEDSEAGTRAAAAANAVIVSIPHEHSRSQNFDTATHIAESLTDPYILDLLS